MDEDLRYTAVHRPRGRLSAGVEQEFEIFLAGAKLDFQRVFPAVARKLGGVPFRGRDLAAVVDPGYMLASDDTEAEFATAPIDLTGTGANEAGTITLANGGSWTALGYVAGGGIFIGSSTNAKDRKSTRLNSSHIQKSRMPSSA